MNLDQMAQQSYQQNQEAQNRYNANVSQYTNEYNQDAANARNAQNQLQNFTKNMRSGTDFYQQGVQQGNINAGYDVNNLNQAQNQVSQLTSILGNLPRAVQSQNANYGATAGQIAGQLSTEGSALGNSLSLANQNAQNQIAKQQAGLTYGQQFAGAGLQGQQQQLTGYQQTAQNAVSIMDQARQTMNSWAQIAQQQGGLTAAQQASYAQAKQALAASQQALAQVGLINAQAASERYKLQQAQQTSQAAAAASQPSAAPSSPAPSPSNAYNVASPSGLSFGGIANQFGRDIRSGNVFGGIQDIVGSPAGLLNSLITGRL